MRTLKPLVLAVGTVLTLGACAPAAPPAVDTAADEAALKAATRTWLEAYNAGDVEKIVALYAEDAGTDASTCACGKRARRDTCVPDSRHGRSESCGHQARAGHIHSWRRWRHGLGIRNLHRHRRSWHHRRQRQLFVGVAQVEWQVALPPRHLQLGPAAPGGSSC